MSVDQQVQSLSIEELTGKRVMIWPLQSKFLQILCSTLCIQTGYNVENDLQVSIFIL